MGCSRRGGGKGTQVGWGRRAAGGTDGQEGRGHRWGGAGGWGPEDWVVIHVATSSGGSSSTELEDVAVAILGGE